MNFFKFLSVFATANMIAFVPAVADARTIDEIQAAGTIVIGTDGTFPPFQYFEGSKLTGFEIDLGDEIAKRMGVKAEWKPMAFDSLLAGLKQDRWDIVLASFSVTAERAKAIDFTDTHYCTGGVIVTIAPGIKAATDLAEKTAAVQTGSVYFDALQKMGKLKQIRNFAADSEARNALVAKRADAWVTEKFVALAAIAGNPAMGLQVAGDFGSPLRVATAVNKGNTTVLAMYNRTLAEMLRDGSYARISTKWFKTDIRCTS